MSKKKHILCNTELIDEQFLADLPKRRKRPDWILKEPLASVGAWEPLFHRRRTGDSWVDDEKFYACEHSERFVRSIKEIGANLLITAFAKNHYIDEREIPLKKQLSGLCRKHGLRLGTYIRADEIYAEVFGDLLSREDILSAQADGRVPVHTSQEWRKCNCFHKPLSRELFKADIRRAIVDVGVDALHLDGFEFGGFETRGACRCAACRQDFREFLVRRYGNDPELCRRRFGHTCIEAIEPPGSAALLAMPSVPTGLVSDPVWQEWIIFRCTWTARIAREMSEYAYDLNPDVAILANNGVVVGTNGALYAGLDLISFGGSVDALINEDPSHPRLTADGHVIQRARQHKMAHEAGCWLWNYMDVRESDLKESLAHASALNQGRVACLGFTFGLYGDFRHAAPVKKAFLSWQKTNWKEFQGLQEIADVAVWRDRRAMAFAPLVSYATAMQVEQLLIEDRIPFAVSQGAWPADARVVVVPDLACLDDRACEKLVGFVRNGGGALIVGETSARDGWGRRRTDFALRPILPAETGLPAGVGFRYDDALGDAVFLPEPAEPQDPGVFHFHQVGKGRVVYVKSLVDPASQPVMFNPDWTAEWPYDTTNWRVPQQADELRRALDWLAGNHYTLRVESSRGVIANYYRGPGKNDWSVHLVNMTHKPVFDTVIRAEREGNILPRVRVISPDGPDCCTAETTADRRGMRITLARLETYAVILQRKAVDGRW